MWKNSEPKNEREISAILAFFTKREFLFVAFRFKSTEIRVLLVTLFRKGFVITWTRFFGGGDFVVSAEFV
jgi:hypothetical protein